MPACLKMQVQLHEKLLFKKKIYIWENSNSVLIFITFKLVTLQEQPNYVKDKLK